ncbi:amidohydrolase family protein [Rhodococcus wratislaviensis]|uniref:Amidohydrolase-related domain-containing protein n=1 Tax=Rhodococcus wratislaviensis NBRC 100605 TaxID=1219028 RepID=X0PMC0_RHOWR|nr:amidohydrolase family protein [Rhodococcus wratislaviensis]GAF43598.1 hypothetical protein RW1_009_00220 [Rhodococcus wratislaviensis NBRC 100605]
MESIVEEVLDADLPICDAHHHLWDTPNHRYLLDELRADVRAGHNVVNTVYVECRWGYRTSGPESFRPVGETDFVVRADPKGLVAGIVGFADLTKPDVDDVLAAHIEAGRGRFRGIRHVCAWDEDPTIRTSYTNPSPTLLADPTFRAGIAALGRAGLSFDAWVYHPQLSDLAELARACPEVTIVVDHLGGPLGIGPYAGRRNEVLDVWRLGMEKLAKTENVVLKLGGIGMAMYGLGWHKQSKPPTSEDLARAWRDEYRWCIERFGPERCMFESNFPVDSTSCSYLVLWNSFKRIVADGSAADKAALFHDTAVRTYGLSRS